jgi:uncharacterized protein YndB with AHSA1/START domain
MTATTTDRIEKKSLISAPLPRVWRALSDAREFGQWFRVALEAPFAEHTTVRGKVTYPGYEHLTVEMAVERIEPEHFFSYRWRPHAVDLNYDYSKEPMTLVEFSLEATDGGTWLTIVESGFDGIPASRRAEAFRMNEAGWSHQIANIEKYVRAQ